MLGAPSTFLAAYTLVHPGGVALLSAAVSAGATAVVGRLARRLRMESALVSEPATGGGPERLHRWCLVASACAVVAAASGLWIGRPLFATLAAAVAYGVMTLAWAGYALAHPRALQGDAPADGDVFSAAWRSEVERIRGLTCVQILRAQHKWAEVETSGEDVSPEGAVQISWSDHSSTVFDVDSGWALSVERGPWSNPLGGADPSVFGGWALVAVSRDDPIRVAIGDVVGEVVHRVDEMGQLSAVDMHFSKSVVVMTSREGDLRCTVES